MCVGELAVLLQSSCVSKLTVAHLVFQIWQHRCITRSSPHSSKNSRLDTYNLYIHSHSVFHYNNTLPITLFLIISLSVNALSASITFFSISHGLAPATSLHPHRVCLPLLKAGRRAHSHQVSLHKCPKMSSSPGYLSWRGGKEASFPIAGLRSPEGHQRVIS